MAVLTQPKRSQPNGQFMSHAELRRLLNVPEEAMRLTEDVFALRQAIRLLQTVDRYNVDKNPDSDVLWLAIQKLKQCQRYASRKLAIEYLDPRKKLLNGRRTPSV